MSVVFRSPTQEDLPRPRDDGPGRLMRHIRQPPRGRHVIKLNGTWRTTDVLTTDIEAAATYVLYGGHETVVSNEVAAELVAAGYDVAPSTATLTIFGDAADVGAFDANVAVSTGHSVSYQPVPGWDIEAGAALFGCATHGGLVYVGNLTASGNSLNGSYVSPAVHVFDPENMAWATVTLETDEGETGVVGSDGWGRGDVLSFVVAGGRVLGFVFVDYSDWVIATHGRYPGLLVFDGTELASSLTVPELRAAAADGNGALSWPDAVNSHAETYAANQGPSDAATLPNGEVVVVDYLPPSGAYSGAVKVLDANGAEQAFYRFPDMTAHDATDITFAPKFVSVDPSATDPTDMRFVVTADVFPRGLTSNLPHLVIEMSYNASTGDIAAVCAPVMAPTSDEDDFANYTGLAAAAVFDAEGTCWVGCGSSAGFGLAQKPMGAWIATAGERRWATDVPASPGWESDVGSVRAVPDFELGVLDKASSLLSGLAVDPETGGLVVIGFSGRVFPFLPDTPLALRSSVLSNSLYTSNITGWTQFGLTGTATYDSGDGGRLKFTANGSSSSAFWQTDSAGVYSALPADAEGQSLWLWANLKAAATARRGRVSVDFYTSGGVHVGTQASGPWSDTDTSGYTKVACAVEVPATATHYKMFVTVNRESGGVIPNAEVHYSDQAYLALAPVTHLDELSLDLTDLNLGAADLIWPSGLGNQSDIDDNGDWWVPIRPRSLTLDGVALPSYLARINLAALLTPGIR